MNKLLTLLFIMAMYTACLVGCDTTYLTEKDSTASIQSSNQPSGITTDKTNSEQNLDEKEEKVDIKKLKSVFGFSDMSGKYLIVWKDYKNIKNPNGIEKAIGDDGNILSIRFLKVQISNEKNNNRELSNNFHNLDGYIYEITQGNAIPNNSYYLVNEKEFNTKAIVKTEQAGNANTDKKIVSRIEEIKKIKVSQCWTISNVNPEKYICVVVFERQNDDLLVNLAYITPEQIIFKDYSSKYDIDIDSALSNNDISPNMFKILFVAHTNEGILFAVSHIDYESIESNLMIEANGKFKDINIGEVRYTAPL